MADRVQVFISSTFEDHALDREFIEILCKEMNLTPKMFPEHSIAGRSREYLKALSESHVMLLLVPDRNSKPVKEEIDCSRMNGIPFVPFFKVKPGAAKNYRSILNRSKKFKLEHSTEHACVYSTLNELSRGVKDGIAAILATRMSDKLVLMPWTADVYEQARVFLPLSGSRLGIAQCTSTFILGPHIDRLQENAFHDNCYEFIESILSGSNDVRLLHVFDRKATMNDIVDNKVSYPYLKETLNRLEKLLPEIDATTSVKFIPTDGNLTPAMVGDNRFQVATVFGDQRFYMWLSESRSGANRLWEILNGITPSKSLSDFIVEAKASL